MDVILQPVAMIAVSAECIYAHSRTEQSRVISESEFVEKYADNSHSILISHHEDGISNPIEMTAYSFGLDHWYIAY